MARKPTGKLRRWRITLIREKGRYVGKVEAPGAETAIEVAAETYGIDEVRRRLIAQPLS